MTEAHRLTITGPGRDALTISGDTDNNSTADTQLFRVTADDSSATVSMSGLTLTKGTSADGGGAIHAEGPRNTVPLVLTDAAVTNSVSTWNASDRVAAGSTPRATSR